MFFPMKRSDLAHIQWRKALLIKKQADGFVKEKSFHSAAAVKGGRFSRNILMLLYEKNR